jgi:hypothetical protein
MSIAGHVCGGFLAMSEDALLYIIEREGLQVTLSDNCENVEGPPMLGWQTG